MATPDFVKHSRISRPVAEMLAELEATVLRQFGLEYDRFAALEKEADPDSAAYNGGLDLAGDLVQCKSRAEAISLARGSEAWGLTFLAREARAGIYLYLFDFRVDSYSAALSFDTSMLTFEAENQAKGSWFRGLLVALVAALGCEVCGYGADAAYSLKYESLNPSAILSRLRAGELFTMAYPNFRAVSNKLIQFDEMNALLQKLPKSEFLRYNVATSGYHVLSIIP